MTLTLFNYAGMTVTAILAVILVISIIKQRQAGAKLQNKEELEKQRLYQILILKEIQDRYYRKPQIPFPLLNRFEYCFKK